MSGVARYYAEKVCSHPQGAFVLYEDWSQDRKTVSYRALGSGEN